MDWKKFKIITTILVWVQKIKLSIHWVKVAARLAPWKFDEFGPKGEDTMYTHILAYLTEHPDKMKARAQQMMDDIFTILKVYKEPKIGNDETSD